MLCKTDVVVIGAGAVGSAIARELSRYQLDVVLVEKNEDVGGDASKTNSAMIICGYDTPPNTLENKLIMASNAMFDKISKDLDVPFNRIGALQIAKTKEELISLEKNRKKAIENGVFDIEQLTPSRIKEMEPNLTENIAGGLYIPRESIIDVFELIVAYVENAVDNGVKLMLSTKVTGITKEDGKVRSVITDRGEIQTRYVINAAALYADKIAETVGLADFKNYPRKGEFYILDKNLPYMPNHMIMPIPTPITRGKLIVPTIHGNLLLGPTAIDSTDRVDKSTTKEGLNSIINEVRQMIPAINPKDAVTQFAGLRPARTPSGYTIRSFEVLKGYIEATGILTGISGSPAIASYVVNMLSDEGLELKIKDNFNPYRVGIKKFTEMSEKEQAEIVAENPSYGNIICRCETISESEIVQAIRRNPPARSLDAVKRRVRAGMGRCQGGFCSTKVVEIIAKELGIKPEEVCKNEKGSELIINKNR